ncbi:RES family NAD+ phosphorylase [Thiobacillus sp.]|uniref:RES family NAD+ phosphorylase n=1 Tax=Thiobacillus sp. TaxID=924 RepID=UPI0025ECCA8B|nr:RES family NAD+ phosphorylase [Thiobacillus sp.]
MDAFFAGLPLADVHQDLARNIKSIRVSQNLFDDLSDDPADWEIAQQHELATKPHTYESPNTIIDRPFEEADWLNAIKFPFRNWAASRFCDGSFGIWYGSDLVETTVHETVHHWRGFLAEAGFDELVPQGARESITSERKVYWVRCDAALLNLSARAAEYPDLVHPTSYPFTQQIGARLHRESHPGFVTRSARCVGVNYGVLNRNVLSSPRACCSLTYRLTRDGVVVEREAEQTWMVLA